MSVKDHNSRSGNAPKTCSFYDELDEIFSKSPSITPVALASSKTKRALTVRNNNNNNSSSDEISEEVESDSSGKIKKKSKKAKKSKLNRELEAWSKTLREDADKRELARENDMKQ